MLTAVPAVSPAYTASAGQSSQNDCIISIKITLVRSRWSIKPATCCGLFSCESDPAAPSAREFCSVSTPSTWPHSISSRNIRSDASSSASAAAAAATPSLASSSSVDSGGSDAGDSVLRALSRSIAMPGAAIAVSELVGRPSGCSPGCRQPCSLSLPAVRGASSSSASASVSRSKKLRLAGAKSSFRALLKSPGCSAELTVGVSSSLPLRGFSCATAAVAILTSATTSLPAATGVPAAGSVDAPTWWT